MTTASSLSPSGMQLAGKYGMGVLSIASTSSEGLQALPTQWAFAEEAARKHGQTVDRKNWRVLMSWHLAETKEQAQREALHGLHRWHNDYNVEVLGRPGANRVEDPWELMEQTSGGVNGSGAGVIGTPDELVDAIRKLQDVTGGFGVVLGFAHDWADREATLRSWDLFARYVVPEINGYSAHQKKSAQYLSDNKRELIAGASAAVMAKIQSDEKAREAMAVTMQQMRGRDPGWRPNAPDTSSLESKQS
jgi:limonene 1,2-monooxygenase